MTQSIVKCTVCLHPAQQEIDDRLLDGRSKLHEIVQWVIDNYPNNPLNIKTLSNHRSKHLKYQLTLGMGTLSLRDGTIYDGSGRPLETIGIAAALRAIVTVGIANILKYPERVTPRETIEALRMMKSLGAGSEDVDELMAVWSTTIKRPRKPLKELEIDSLDDFLEQE